MKVEVAVLGSRPYGFCGRKATLNETERDPIILTSGSGAGVTTDSTRYSVAAARRTGSHCRSAAAALFDHSQSGLRLDVCPVRPSAGSHSKPHFSA